MCLNGGQVFCCRPSCSAGVLLTEGLIRTALAAPVFNNDPFGLGIASGDPSSTRVILWTKVAPEPLIPGGGIPGQILDVEWDSDFRVVNNAMDDNSRSETAKRFVVEAGSQTL